MMRFLPAVRISHVVRVSSLFASASLIACIVPALSRAAPIVGGTSLAAPTLGTSVTDTTAGVAGVTNYPAGGQGAAGTASYANGSDVGSATTSLGSAASGPWVIASSTSTNSVVSADAFVSYQIEVVGSSKKTDLGATLDFTASGGTDGRPEAADVGKFSGSASAIFDLYVPQATTYLGFTSLTDLASEVCIPGGGCGLLSDNIQNGQWTVPINEVLTVDIEASVNPSAAGGFLLASVDPTFYLDSNNPSGLTLAFSPSIDQPGIPQSVPEPPALLSVAIGFGLAFLANMLWRRRPRQPA